MVNLDKGIQEVIWEARWLRHLGLEVPQSAQAILLQEEKFNVYYHRLSHALEVGVQAICRSVITPEEAYVVRVLMLTATVANSCMKEYP